MAGWSGRSRGGYAGTLFFVLAVRGFGRWPAYAVATVVAASFLGLAPAARRASRAYLRRHGRTGGLVDVWRHFYVFACSLIDRVVHAAEGDGAFAVRSSGLEHIAPGTLLVTAHTGNWELAGRLLKKRLPARLSIVVWPGEVEAVRAALAHVPATDQPDVIPADGMAALSIARALRDGGVVAVQADRCIDDRVVWHEFLGAPAPFPLGPWLVAAATRCPVVATFGARLDARTYEFVAIAAPATDDRGRDAAVAASRWYVGELERWLVRHPLQWFNFFDFWSAPVSPRTPPETR